MAKGSSYQFLDLAKPTIPYRSYTSPVDEQPHFIPGAKNILGTEIGYLEKRPGFSTPVESALSTVPGKIVRIFTWRRWGGSFYVMLCSIVSGVATVYKLQQGTDPSFILCWTSASATPFDFVVSNNFCFFGNGADMRKFDGTTVSKWGCDAPGFAPTFSLATGTLPAGMSFADPVLSGTPTTTGTSQITFTATDSTGATGVLTYNFVVDAPVLAITTIPFQSTAVGALTFAYNFTVVADFGSPAYTFTIFSGSLPPGLSLSSSGHITGTPTASGTFNFAIKVTDSLSHTAVRSVTLFIETGTTITFSPGSPLTTGTVGSLYTTQTITAAAGTAPYSFSTGFGTLPPGLTFTNGSPSCTIQGTPTTAGDYFFGIFVTDSASRSQVMIYRISIFPVDVQFINTILPAGVVGHAYTQTLEVEGGTGPYTITFTAGTLNAQSGYVWGYSYTTTYGHESNVSPLSDQSGLFTGEDALVTVVASPDSQVTGINLYRTSDGGAQDPSIMRLLAQLPNTNATFIDSTQDVNLGLQTGPAFLANTPPTPCLGFVWSNGRIYGSFNNQTFYSGAEEISNGIQEEAWPSGLDGNFYAWPSEIGGMGVTANGVDIGLSEQFWQVSGDTLDTFRKGLLLDKAGVRSPTCINSVGNSVQWVDTAKQVWSSSLGEFGEPIRSDLNNLDPNQTFIGYHKSKLYNWIYLLDALGGLLYIFDLDLNQWNAPWTVAATAIASGETSLGNLSLLVAIGGHVVVLTPGTYVDDRSLYEDDFKIGLLPISPGRLTTARTKIEPTQIEKVEFETNATSPTPSFVGVLCDDDPTVADQAEWFDITNYSVTPQFIPVGNSLIQQGYTADSTTDPAIRASFWIQLAPSSIGWKMYSFTISWIKA